MVQGAVGLLAALPTALVHALNLFVPSSGSLVLLGARNRNERVYCRDGVATLREHVSHAFFSKWSYASFIPVIPCQVLWEDQKLRDDRNVPCCAEVGRLLEASDARRSR